VEEDQQDNERGNGERAAKGEGGADGSGVSRVFGVRIFGPRREVAGESKGDPAGQPEGQGQEPEKTGESFKR
jgi:hypothetical protein